MLSLSRVSQFQGQTYYTNENYYTREKAVENSEWQGIGAGLLGLQGKVDAKVFQGLLEGKSPQESVRLGCDHDNGDAKRRAGIDLTFSAPKSVSVAALVGRDQRLEFAHREAVTEALRIAEERYAITRIGAKNARQNLSTGNIIAAKFQHDTSRAKDPQLHTHCVVMNAVRRDDGEWRSLHNDELFANSKLLGLVYQNDLAARVKALGYEIERKANGTFEIRGYTEEQLRSFSKRREKIEELGAENQKQARTLVKVERPNKGRELDRDELRIRWDSEAKNLGIAHPVSQSLAQKNAVDTADAVLSASRHATEKNVSFRREKMESFALESNLGSVIWRALQREIFKQETACNLISHAPGRFTTHDAIQTEKTILANLQNGAGKNAPIGAGNLAENRWNLNQGQLDAAGLALTSRDQFLLWHGVAGAGKTYAMNVVREIASERGVQVRGFAPSAEAAKVLESEAKIPSQTVAGLLTTPHRITERGVRELWIVDEAGLMSARDSAKFMQRAVAENAQVVFVGDTRQLSAVEAGNPFKLMRENGIPTAELNESRRQKNEVLKASVNLMARGQQREALGAIGAQIVELKREESRTRFITSEFTKLSPEERKETLILAGTNREREVITGAIRAVLKSEKNLGEGTTVETLRARDLSREELVNAAKFEVGNTLAFHKDAKAIGIKKGDLCDVINVDTNRNALTVRRQDGTTTIFKPERHKNSFLAFEKKATEVCAGERLRWTKNDKTLGGVTGMVENEWVQVPSQPWKEGMSRQYDKGVRRNSSSI